MPVGQFQLSESLRKKTGRFAKISPVMERIGTEVILPAYGRRYTEAGLRQRTGRAYRALTKRGAAGNLFVVRDNVLEAGVTTRLWNDYLKFPIEGHKSAVIRVKRVGGRALKITLPGGVVIYRKTVRGTRPHMGAAPSAYTPSAADTRKMMLIIEEEMAK